MLKCISVLFIVVQFHQSVSEHFASDDYFAIALPFEVDVRVVLALL